MDDVEPHQNCPVLSVIIPVYNEQATLPELLERVDRVDIAKQIIIVDDGSTDDTAAVLARWAARPDVMVLSHDRNRGKGAALSTGLTAATGRVILFQDADLEYDPADYSALIGPLLDGHADVVYGSRFSGNAVAGFLWQRLANRLITLACNLWTRMSLTDVETGYKVFRREVITALDIAEPGFGVEIELTVKSSRLNRPEGGPLRIREVPIRFHPRRYAEGKKITWRDGLHALWCIVRYSLVPMRRRSKDRATGPSPRHGGCPRECASRNDQ